MPRILNFGSLNLDYVFSVDHFVQPGETISSRKFEIIPGGKGMNQSVALARAGGDVSHAGRVGSDGDALIALLRENGVDTGCVDAGGSTTGKAIIQVDRSGQNCIVLHSGANGEITPELIDSVLSGFGPGDVLVLQNEVNLLDTIVDRAHRQGMRIALNPSPVNEQLEKIDLAKITWLLLNEIEGKVLTGREDPVEILEVLLERYPDIRAVLTLGKDGVVYRDAQTTCSHGIYDVEVVDTTAAGDTFAGYFLSLIAAETPVAEALELASVASSLAVSRRGAAISIPRLEEVRCHNLKPCHI